MTLFLHDALAARRARDIEWLATVGSIHPMAKRRGWWARFWTEVVR